MILVQNMHEDICTVLLYVARSVQTGLEVELERILYLTLRILLQHFYFFFKYHRLSISSPG